MKKKHIAITILKELDSKIYDELEALKDIMKGVRKLLYLRKK